MRLSFAAALAMLLALVPAIQAQTDSFRLTESFPKDTQYHVHCQVEITGTLPIATDKQAAAKMLPVSGKSTISYDERILQVTSDRRVDRTLRSYRQMEFERKVGDRTQQNQLRPEVRRLVILRHNQYEVPFSPAGALTWGEIDLVRTDIFVPALQGLFPPRPVRVGERWHADNIAVQEITDLDKIEKADFVCTFDKITTLLGRRNAHVSFEGKVAGVGEDGNALHEVRGSFYHDLDANFLSYLSIKGTHYLLGKDGKGTGKIEGTFVMTRSPAPVTRELTDEAIRGLTLEPNADNTLLLFDNPQLGIRFLYPRNWRVAGANKEQIAIDDNRGNGMLVTLSAGTATPTGAQFQQETLKWLSKNQAKIGRAEKPRTLQPGLEMFTIEGEVDRQKVVLQYFTVRHDKFGATVAARLLPGDSRGAQSDAERIVRSIQLSAPK